MVSRVGLGVQGWVLALRQLHSFLGMLPVTLTKDGYCWAGLNTEENVYAVA